MNGTIGKELFIKLAGADYAELGFYPAKNRTTEILMERKKPDGWERISIRSLDYRPDIRMEFGLSKRIESIEKVVKKICEHTNVNQSLYGTNSVSFYIRGNTLNPWNHISRHLPYISDEAGIKETADIILHYLKTEAIPLLDRLDDIREIDRMINGEGENFWEDDEKKPFTLAHLFYMRRLIIARLSGRADYEDFVERIFQYEATRHLQKGWNPFDRNDVDHPTVLVLKMLKDVKSLD